ncbi:MAG: tRNA (adenosine(37)-N6)-threonylcarbamoyltransferase complex dimerization subunit type 1 TsaB [Myxococcales bacterium]|nr:tRNA (adenosine(37)-N6)-threonylcarbamoyltransferase complex dimerization subunit type 1 TsaB [Myxococcales bacterium]
MIVLGIETSSQVASVALLANGTLLAEREALVTTHSERLLPLLAETLAAAGLRAADVDLLACGAGPGSFTGLRIGLATAKGLAFALDKPLLVTSSLAALALDAAEHAGPHALVLTLLDARRSEVYAGLFCTAPLAPLFDELVIAPVALEERVRAAAAGRQVFVVGDGARAYPEAAARLGELLPGARATPRALAVCRLALLRHEAGAGDELVTSAPSYVRASEVELAHPLPVGGGK